MPAAYPIERPKTGTHGHSWGQRQGDDLHKRWSGGAQSQPSKLGLSSSSLPAAGEPTTGANARRLPRTSSDGAERLALMTASLTYFPRPVQTPCPCLGVKGGVEPADLPRLSQDGNQNTSSNAASTHQTACPLHARSGGQTRVVTGTHGTRAMTITCTSAGLARPNHSLLSSGSRPSWH